MVNSPSAYFLLLLYLTVVFKPLVPVVQDVWEHTFNEVQHLATVHQHSGSHHLQKEIAGQDNGNDNHNDHNLKADDEVPVHLLAKVGALDFNTAECICNHTLLPHQQLALIVLSSPSPPPKKHNVLQQRCTYTIVNGTEACSQW